MTVGTAAITGARQAPNIQVSASIPAFAPTGGRGYQLVKRLLDVVLASLVLTLVAPLMLLTAVIIKLSSRGDVIFRQTRAGLDGVPFTMFKFRTMRNGAENDRQFIAHLNVQDGPVFKIPDDPRLTPIGKFLRRSSIDELPQLLNVLKGQMSLVGPRPLWWPESTQVKGAAKFRMNVKPGLTCLWQISGRSELTYDEWVRLDLYYMRHRSTLLDTLIVIQTLPAILSGHGAF